VNINGPPARLRLTRAAVSGPAVSLGLLLALAMATDGCRSTGAPRAPEAAPSSKAPAITSNMLREDYVGSAACAPCHADVYKVWSRSPMHRMTRLPEQTEIRAPFDGRTFQFKNDSARLEKVGTSRFVRLQSATTGEHLYRVTKVIGGRYREDFAGQEVASTEPGAAVLGDPHAELILPTSYVFQTGAFRLKGYSVMVGERPGMRAGGVWNQTCIFCHNTVPYFDDVWGALHGPGAPGYQGEVVDRLLPARRRLDYTVTDGGQLLAALDRETAVLGAGQGVATRAGQGEAQPARAALRRAMLEARGRFQPSHFVEVGIGCEACHGGGRQHVDDPRRVPTFAPRAPFLDVHASGGPASEAEWQNRTCARCHQVLFSRYSRTWEGGSRRQPEQAGGSHITSGEGRDFLLGGCARAMSCATCHDPHREDSREHLAQLATPAGNAVCIKCHGELASPVALQRHAHHDPVGAGGSCVACHMPRKNMGLGYALTRYHRIGSPTDRARVEGDRPLECAICHGDKTVGALLDDMARLWGKQYDAAAIQRLYGDRDQNVLVATITRGYAHEQATAMALAGERRLQPAGAAIAHEMTGNAYPLVRLWAGIAYEALAGRPPSADMEKAAAAAGAAHGGSDADDED